VKYHAFIFLTSKWHLYEKFYIHQSKGKFNPAGWNNSLLRHCNLGYLPRPVTANYICIIAAVQLSVPDNCRVNAPFAANALSPKIDGGS
jgi:hypothetical protein